jgi:hypothetical protein
MLRYVNQQALQKKGAYPKEASVAATFAIWTAIRVHVAPRLHIIVWIGAVGDACTSLRRRAAICLQTHTSHASACLLVPGHTKVFFAPAAHAWGAPQRARSKLFRLGLAYIDLNFEMVSASTVAPLEQMQGLLACCHSHKCVHSSLTYFVPHLDQLSPEEGLSDSNRGSHQNNYYPRTMRDHPRMLQVCY